MKKYKILIAFLTLFLSLNFMYGQSKYEREYRIKKCQFPSNALDLIQEKLIDVKRIRFYRETDSTKTSYETKFKRDNLHYGIEFNEKGELQDVKIVIKEVDIPEEAWTNITRYLEEEFEKYKIKKMYQQYKSTENEPIDTTLKNAFQNLLLPSINYKIIVAGKKQNSYEDYEILFSGMGIFTKSKKSLPANHDHVLY